MQHTIVVLGGAGFVGRETVREAMAAGLRVRAVIRSSAARAAAESLGADVVVADAACAADWIGAADGTLAVIDLIQPAIPRRLGTRRLARIARSRERATRAITAALRGVPAERRPLYLSVSGTADLERDDHGAVSHRSGMTRHPHGFAAIGVRVRQAVVDARIDAAFVHLGTVYGPGKAFATRIVPGLQRGMQPIFGSGANHLPLVHVSDAARALVHLAQLPRSETAGRQWIVADGGDATQSDFFRTTAALLGAPAPRQLPRWLGRIIAGSGIIDELCKDVRADPTALVDTGFRLRYPALRDGIAATLHRMNIPVPARSAPV